MSVEVLECHLGERVEERARGFGRPEGLFGNDDFIWPLRSKACFRIRCGKLPEPFLRFHTTFSLKLEDSGGTLYLNPALSRGVIQTVREYD